MLRRKTRPRSGSSEPGVSFTPLHVVHDQITSSPQFATNVRRLAAELGHDEGSVRATVERHLVEMVTSWNPALMNVNVHFGRFLYRQGYDRELDYHPEQMAPLHQLRGRVPMVLLFTHRSNLDAVVVQIACHENGLPKPHTFGGVNMAFWPLGWLMRRAGVIFIQRSGHGDRLYRQALREYIRHLVGKRATLQWSIEGTRSRTGKLAPPKLGLLTYVAEALAGGSAEDVLLVPISITYDQLSEVREYAAYAKGAEKQQEGLRWLVKFTRGQRGQFGRVYVRVAEPVSLAAMLGDVGAADPAFRTTLHKAALEVSFRLNQVTPITATASVVSTLLGVQGRALTFNELDAVLRGLVQYADSRGMPMTVSCRELGSSGNLQAVLDDLIRNDVVTSFRDGFDPVYSIQADRHVAAAYYRNTIVHFMLDSAISELALLHAATIDPPEDQVSAFWDEALRLRDLLKLDFFFHERDDFVAGLTAELTARDPEWEQLVRSGTPGVERLLDNRQPLTAHVALRSFLETYSLLADVLLRVSGMPDDKHLLDMCLGVGSQYLRQGRLHGPESLSKPLFQSALELARHRRLLDDDRDVDARRRAFVQEVRYAVARCAEISRRATVQLQQVLEIRATEGAGPAADDTEPIAS